MKIDNKNILVTGANRGIGAAIVRELLKHKVGKVYAAARNVKNLPDFGDKRVIPLALDITDSKQVADLAKQAKDINILINNAGTIAFASIIEGQLDQIAADMKVNYFGTIGMMQAFAPVLQKNGQGMIANVISIIGLAPMVSVGGYSASKAALHSATQSARTELAARNIHVIGIYPGPIDTEMARDFPIAKTSPAVTAQAIVAGIIEGKDYIFPDPMSQQMGALWEQNPKAVEKQFAAPMTDAA